LLSPVKYLVTASTRVSVSLVGPQMNEDKMNRYCNQTLQLLQYKLLMPLAAKN